VARHDARVTHAERIQPGPFSRSLGFQLVRAGKRVAAAEAEVTQEGQVIARAMTSHARLES
jgi:acyl-coenzyme A thioesterase PaaI-like protein